jgi:hypothetical protein
MLENLIRRARRRLVFNQALGQLAFTGALVIAGLALLLILGTRYLEWWTLLLVAAIGVGIGVGRVYRGVPNEYRTAVLVDRSAGLSDALSTAVYFSAHAPGYPEFLGAQRQQAESAARGVHLDSAVPFTFPKALYAMAGMGLLASGLVIVRFTMGHGLDLRPPITEVIFEDEAARNLGKPKSPADALAQKRLEDAESLLAKLGAPINPNEQKQQEAMDKAIDQALENAGVPADKGAKGQAGKSEQSQAGNALQAPEGDPLNGRNPDGNQNGQGKNGQNPQAGDKGKNGQGDSSSLLSKLKDAVSNMFSKANADKQGQKSQQQGQSAKSDKGPSEKGAATKNQEGQNQSDAQDGEPQSDDAQDGQQAEGKPGAKNSDLSAKSGSGAGSQDGAKDLKAAEQLKAMGKISEIIGKRAATVTGETTIEVESGNQQLRTAYTSKSARHGEADGDVSRDEIPVSVQSYVQQYFEQVRKAAGGQKAKAAVSN